MNPLFQAASFLAVGVQECAVLTFTPIGTGGDAEFAFELHREMLGGGEAQGKGDLRNGLIGIP